MRCVCKKITLKVREIMYRKITSIQNNISIRKEKERIRVQLQQRKREKKHLVVIAKNMGTIMRIWKLHPELILKWFGGQRKQRTIATMQQYIGSDLGDEENIITIGLQGKFSFHAISSSQIPSLENDERRSELFHIRVVTKHTKVETLFDQGSQVNLIS